MRPEEALSQVLAAGGLETALAGQARFEGSEPVLPARFMLATAGAAAIAASGLAAAEVWRERTGRRQDVAVELRHAAAALRSGSLITVDGRPPGDPWGSISGIYKTGDGRWVQYHCNYPHHRDGVLRLLGCPEDRAAVQAATARWQAQPLEDELARLGMCAGIVRSRAEWERHPQGQAVAQLPLIEVMRIGDSPPEAPGKGDRPLSGVRVLDLSRVLAGPIGARTLAEHGADVMRITAAHLPAQPDVDIDTGHGKLSAQLDLRDQAQHARLLNLARQADVFLQAYRPGTLAARGFSPQALAEARPGIIYVTLSAYGHEGPWAGRRGFDSLVQSVSGIVDENSAGAEPPRHLPAQALDYCSGYLLAFGAVVALLRRAREGGSYLVRASLAQTGQWLHQLGRVDADRAATVRPGAVDDLMVEQDSPFGRLRYLRPAARLSQTPGRWERPAVPLGFHAPAWP
jgi:crotonobetainyl-CoA:carnitine CoA-transferase CaiB-like acyl-CoA transferase